MQLPSSLAPFRILSIDPGSDTLGVSVLDVDLVNRTTTLIYVHTFVASRTTSRWEQTIPIYSDRQLRLQFHLENLLELFYQFAPHAVIAENAYSGRFATAFETLVEVRASIAKAVSLYDPSIMLELVDPPSVKLAVGAKVYKGSKEDVQQHVIDYPHLNWQLPSNTLVINEHGYDSIAVGIYKSQQILMSPLLLTR